MKPFSIICILLCFTFKIYGQSYQNIVIYTPNGTSITARKLISGDYTNSQKQQFKEYYLAYYNNRIIYIDEATRSYNCHAYAWHVSEGGEKVWINTPDDDTYWNDGSYEETNAADATKISFVSDDHSAITTSQSEYIESKWGAMPLFRHRITDCPYSYSSIKYYKKTCPTTTISNVNYNTNTTINDCNVTLQNVEVQNNAKLTIDANETTINGPFEVQIGAELEIK